MKMFSFDDEVVLKYHRHANRHQVVTAVCLPDTDPAAVRAVQRYERVQVGLQTSNPTPKRRRQIQKKLSAARERLFRVVCTQLKGVGVHGEDGELVDIMTCDDWQDRVPPHERDQIGALYMSRTVLDEDEAGN